MEKYLKRVADDILRKKLEASGAVLIVGPKWCGKTSTGEQIAQSVLFMQDPRQSVAYQKIADVDPSLLLAGPTPRLIDEWQMAPRLWDAVRFTIDQRKKENQFILTGSTCVDWNTVTHSGTGRISRMVMRPMSLYESLDSTGTVSLKDLFEKETEIKGLSAHSIPDLAKLIIRGGWPASIGTSETIAFQKAVDYVDSIIQIDISRENGVEKNPFLVRAFMKSYARNLSTMASVATIQKDIAGFDETLSDKTIASYIQSLRNLFVIEDLPAWNPSLRSKTAMRSSLKRHFVDPSIATSLFRMTPGKLLEDFHYFGFLFESLCLRDLRIYASALDGEVFHYHDRNDLEIDAVICLNDGRWGAIEIKLGSSEIEKGIQNLLRLTKVVDTDKMSEPSFLMVLTGTGYAFTQKEGVFIVPIGCLKD